MKRTKLGYRSSASIQHRLFLAAAAAMLVCTTAAASPWSRVKATASGPAAAIGGAANGCLAGAQALSAKGKGFVSIRRHRNRYYGHPQTVALVRDLGTALSKRTDQVMMVGDLSQPRGGLMSSSHRSHQNGLDVDIWFRLASSASAAKRDTPEALDPESMLRLNGLALSNAWGKEQRFLLITAAKHPRVDRIFVNAGIKRALCDTEKGDRSWLGKLRPWWGHDAHFHVRLKCPSDSLDCRRQAPVPAGEGCGSSLAWWFSPEARAPKKKSAKPKARPPMPAACKTLLTGY